MQVHGNRNTKFEELITERKFVINENTRKAELLDDLIDRMESNRISS